MSLDRSSISSRVSALFASHFFGVGLFLPFIPVVLGFRGLTAAEIAGGQVSVTKAGHVTTS